MLRTRPLLLSSCLALALALLPAGVAAAADPIMPLSQVQPGMQCTGETVISGITISSFAVDVISVVQAPPQGAMIMVSVSGPAVDASGVAFGFSGSPILCPAADGTPSIIGALSQGIGQYGNNVVLATPIQQMLGQPVLPPSAAPRLTVRTRPLDGPLTVSGLSPALAALVARAGQQAGRAVAPAPVGGAPSYAVQPLVPGASVAAAYSTGAIGIGAVGTVSYRDGANVYAFGHELDGAGRRSLFLQDAYVYGIVDNPSPAADGSYKLAAPGHVEGTLTSDNPSDVIGQVGAPPPSIPVDVAARDLDTGHTLTLDSSVADETDIGDPVGDLLDIVAPTAVAQAATQIYDGPPANESGTMCLRVYLRESRAPLGFCSRYVASGAPGDQGLIPPALALATSGDVTTALSLLDSVQFATLHVTRVTASIDARRGLAEGTIMQAQAPASAVAGGLLPVRLFVRHYQGALQQISLRLRIPRGLHGPVLVTLKGPSSGGSGSAAALEAALASAIGGSGGGGAGSLGSSSAGSGPASIAALRSRVAAISKYDGVTASFLAATSRHPGAARPAYRDPSLLIMGKASVFVVVRRH
ncbi:MAG TPA: hypothetical protein VG295_04740 [Solirubrobacteraceae bacterium]|nr:hypothetical protein [Solirubrobacteraceae bacterium]